MTSAPKEPPEEFYKIVNDFLSDILTTFPEYTGLVAKWWNRPHVAKEKAKVQAQETLFVFRHCLKVFPERFFDILYKNAEIFSKDSEINTEFLPGIVFRQLWETDISDQTKESIWKYLQLLLFSVIGSVHNQSELGDAAKLFEAINEDELKQKLEETMASMEELFTQRGSNGEDGESSSSSVPPPNAEHLHEHLNSMMGGKLGKLALELAEETSRDLDIDMENTGDTKDLFQKLFKNPGKMMNMVKNIGSKLDEKIKSGEIKESELMEEGMELLNKMKDMPGMSDMQKMFSQFGLPGLGKGAKLNMGAMEAQMNRNMKTAKMKEKLRAKAMAKEMAKAAATVAAETAKATTTAATPVPSVSEADIIQIFSTGEKVEKTMRKAKKGKK